MNYKNPTPVVVCLVRDANTFLGVLRSIAPIGNALPGGYIDEGESAEMAASRELREETGLIIEPAQWKLICTRIAPGNKLLIFVEAEYPLDSLSTFNPNNEVSKLITLTPYSELVFPIHTEVLRSRQLS